MQSELNPHALADLRAALAGPVILPDDEGFNDARAVWNGMIDVRPALIVRPSTATDIAPVLDFASRWGLPLVAVGEYTVQLVVARPASARDPTAPR